MAQRRMFSLKIVDTDAFKQMPASAQSLYFHVGMRADDEGFYAGVKSLMQSIHVGEDDLQVLLARGFLLDRGDGVYVVKHWKINNYLQSDRIESTEYVEKKVGLFIKEDRSYTLKPEKGKPLVETPKSADEKPCIQNGYIDLGLDLGLGLDKCSKNKEGLAKGTEALDPNIQKTLDEAKEIFGPKKR